jgi:hypothetical protein
MEKGALTLLSSTMFKECRIKWKALSPDDSKVYKDIFCDHEKTSRQRFMTKSGGGP